MLGKRIKHEGGSEGWYYPCESMQLSWVKVDRGKSLPSISIDVQPEVEKLMRFHVEQSWLSTCYINIDPSKLELSVWVVVSNQDGKRQISHGSDRIHIDQVVYHWIMSVLENDLVVILINPCRVGEGRFQVKYAVGCRQILFGVPLTQSY